MNFFHMNWADTGWCLLQQIRDKMSIFLASFVLKFTCRAVETLVVFSITIFSTSIAWDCKQFVLKLDNCLLMLARLLLLWGGNKCVCCV